MMLSVASRSYARSSAQASRNGLMKVSSPALGGKLDLSRPPVDLDNFPPTDSPQYGYYKHWSLGPYSFFSNTLKGRGSMPPWAVRFHNKITIDVERHFNAQNRFQTMSMWQRYRLMLIDMWEAKYFTSIFFILAIVNLVPIIAEQRREPMEGYMDREVFYKDYFANQYGHHYDAHAYHHRLEARRAKKWGYYDENKHHLHH